MAYLAPPPGRSAPRQWPFNWRLACALSANFAAWALIGWTARRLLANH